MIFGWVEGRGDADAPDDDAVPDAGPSAVHLDVTVGIGAVGNIRVKNRHDTDLDLIRSRDQASFASNDGYAGAEGHLEHGITYIDRRSFGRAEYLPSETDTFTLTGLCDIGSIYAVVETLRWNRVRIRLSGERFGKVFPRHGMNARHVNLQRIGGTSVESDAHAEAC